MAGETNPSLEPVAGLAGDWDMELSNAAFLPTTSDTVHLPASVEWLENGAFLLLRMGDKPPNPAAALWLIGRDQASEGYKVLYYDSRQVSRIYEMSFSAGTWKMWRESPGFSQRYEARVSADGRTIAGRWEKSTDGITWEHDFDVTYTRTAVLGA